MKLCNRLTINALLAGAAALPAAQTVYGFSITSNPAVVRLATFAASAPGTFFDGQPAGTRQAVLLRR